MSENSKFHQNTDVRRKFYKTIFKAEIYLYYKSNQFYDQSVLFRTYITQSDTAKLLEPGYFLTLASLSNGLILYWFTICF